MCVLNEKVRKTVSCSIVESIVDCAFLCVFVCGKRAEQSCVPRTFSVSPLSVRCHLFFLLLVEKRGDRRYSAVRVVISDVREN